MLLFSKCQLKVCFLKHLIFLRKINTQSIKVEFSNNRTLGFNYGKLSKLADGSCVANIGNTNVMVTAVCNNQKVSLNSFIPLLVDYREKSSAGGRIPKNYLRKDLNQNDREILISRLIDRSVRNLFPLGYFNETQIVCNVLSVDFINDPDIAAINAASASLYLSKIPCNGPVGATRVSLLDNQIIINPTRKEIQKSKFDIVCTSNENRKVLMIEGSSNEPVKINDILTLIECSVEENLKIIKGIKKLNESNNKIKKTIPKYYYPNQDLLKETFMISSSKLRKVFENFYLDKLIRDNEIQSIKEYTFSQLKEHNSEEENFLLSYAFVESIKKTYSNFIWETNLRCDGRKLDEIRPLYSEINLYKPLHGSALFQRGLTQVLGTVTFDSPESALKLNNIGFVDEIKEKSFMLHYEFPPYATNDIGRISSIGRREIGHGNLAEKSIKPLLPNDIPFTVRLTAEVLESNGSSSMASVCAGSMALMDAGIDLKEHVAGIAMGLIYNKDKNEHKILTDILGFEDFFGEMDFKIAGTRNEITTLQLDCKFKDGLCLDLIQESLIKSNEARSFIIEHMKSIIKEANKTKTNLPVIEKIEISPYKRSSFLGIGGFNLKKLQAQIGVTITQESDTSNNFIIFAPNQEAMNEAKDWINEKLTSLEEINLDFGAIYTVKIIEIKERGVLVKIHSNLPPVFLKNQELDTKRIKHASALGLKEGDEIQVKYFGRDPANGEIRISRRILQLTQPSINNLLKDN